MTSTPAPRRHWTAACAAFAAVAGALAVGLGAYAAHALEPAAAARLQTASHYLLWHALALLLIANDRAQARWLPALLLAVGMVVFCGSLIAAALLSWPTRLAPVGGSLLILGWLSLAWSKWRP